MTTANQPYLEAHVVMVLATTGPSGLWASPVYYAPYASGLLFVSEPSSRHGINLATHPVAAAAITEDYHDWTQNQGIQLRGICTLRTKDESPQDLQAYCRRFPFAASLLGPDPFSRGLRFYVLHPEEAWMVDNQKGFGRSAMVLPWDSLPDEFLT